MNVHLMRAALLYEQGRWQLAEGEVRQALMSDGDDSEAHRLLALCLNAQEKFDPAETEARMAIHLAPDDADTHYALATVLATRYRFDEALNAVEEALRLDPYDAHSYSLSSYLWFQKQDWTKALTLADQGLAIDPEYKDCLNFKAMALVKLGRKDEASRCLEGLLARDPNDGGSHANQGWTCLEKGNGEQALEHFREALRLDPMNRYARQGILEALKAKYFIYRILLSYFLFMSKLSSRTQWTIMIGMFLLQNFVADISRRNPAAAPVLQWVLFAYTVLVIFTWLGSPLFNLLMFTNRFGRLTLFPDQKWGAITVGSLLLMAATTYGASLYLGDALLQIGALYVAVLALPASAIFLCPEGRPRLTMLAATLALGCVAFLPIALDVLFRLEWLTLKDPATKARFAWLVHNYFWGLVGSQFLANYLVSTVPER